MNLGQQLSRGSFPEDSDLRLVLDGNLRTRPSDGVRPLNRSELGGAFGCVVGANGAELRPIDLHQQLEELLSAHRFSYNTELELQNQLAEVFGKASHDFSREHRFAESKQRVDFMFPSFGTAVEVKIDGGFNAHLRQCQGYAKHEEVAGVILICPHAFSIPASLGGKPFFVIQMWTRTL